MVVMNDWLDDAEAQLEIESGQQEALDDAKTWKPKLGEILKGTMIGAKYLPTKHGWTHLINVLDTDGQAWDVWCGSKLLKEGLMTKHPAMGKGVAIKYKGKKEGKDFEYNDYVFDCEPAQTKEEREERAEFWRALSQSSGEVSEVYEHKPTSSEQAGLEAPF